MTNLRDYINDLVIDVQEVIADEELSLQEQTDEIENLKDDFINKIVARLIG